MSLQLGLFLQTARIVLLTVIVTRPDNARPANALKQNENEWSPDNALKQNENDREIDKEIIPDTGSN